MSKYFISLVSHYHICSSTKSLLFMEPWWYSIPVLNKCGKTACINVPEIFVSQRDIMKFKLFKFQTKINILHIFSSRNALFNRQIFPIRFTYWPFQLTMPICVNIFSVLTPEILILIILLLFQLYSMHISYWTGIQHWKRVVIRVG